MKNLKLFMLTVILALAMNESFSSENSLCITNSDVSKSALSSEKHPNLCLYHQGEIEKYRESVQKLRQDIIELNEKDKVSVDISSSLRECEKLITDIQTKINERKEVLSEYGVNEEEAQRQIEKKIAGVKQVKVGGTPLDILASQGLSASVTANLSQDKIDQIANQRLQSYQKKLDILKNESSEGLEIQLLAAKDKLKDLQRNSSSSDYIKATLEEKIKTLKELYKKHVQGVLRNSDHFPNPKTILKDMGFSSDQIDGFDDEDLYNLFARALELPYLLIETGMEEEEAYLNLLKTIKQHLIYRLKEDAYSIQETFSVVSANKGDIDIMNVHQYCIMVKKFLSEPDSYTVKCNKDQDIKLLNEILSSYGYKKGPWVEKSIVTTSLPIWDPSREELVENILKASPYGLLGLYIASLEYAPVTSWCDSGKASIPARLNNVKSGELSGIVAESIFSFLGHDINQRVLEKIDEQLQKKPVIVPKKRQVHH